MATPSSTVLPTITAVPKGPSPTALAPGPGIQPLAPAQQPQAGSGVPAQAGGQLPAGSPGTAAPVAGAPAAGSAGGLGGVGTGAAAAGQAGAHGGAAPGGPPGASPGAHGPTDLKKVNPYIYTPSFGMAIVGASAMLISSGFHIYQLIKYKSWYFFLMTQAVLMSAAGMIARTHSIMTLKETGATGPFIIFMMLDSIGPTLAVIANIFTMTRVIWWVTPNERRNFQTLKAPPMWISFMWVGLFSLCDIAKSVGQQAFKPHNPTGNKIQEIGAVLQFFILAGYFMFALRFMRMSRRWLIHGAAEEKKWRSLGWTVVICAGILAVRQLFAVVAFDARADPKGFFSLHEWMYWITNTIPLFVVYALYNINFPGEFLPREYTGFRIKLKEIEKAKLEQPWPLTISSPIHRHDDKGVEITLTELERGDSRDGRSRQDGR